MLRFGTDGLRGRAGVELTADVALALGRALPHVLGRGRYLVGMDPRPSSSMLRAAVSAGVAASGADAVDAGTVPTPALAHACAAWECPGVMVSASHNPAHDNGLKVFGPDGRKLTNEQQTAIERLVATAVPSAADPGQVTDVGRDATDAYLAHLADAIETRLDGVRIVLDCANGAASEVGPAAFRAAGADVVVIAAEPDGWNINDGCGATHPAALTAAVVDHGADAGLAFDGDADRVIAVDGDGRVVDGDAVMAICAIDLRDRGRLAHDTLVVTVMSNLGLRLAMSERGIAVVETPVGDRHVLDAMERGGFSLGGEQSGHVIFRELATTGDGSLTGLILLGAVVRSGQPLATLAAGAMTRLPQVLRNVRVADPSALDGADAVWGEVRAVEAELGPTGRVLLRKSGTEPLVRVMVEAPSADDAEAAADRLVTAVSNALGAA